MMISVTVCGHPQQLEEGCSVTRAIARFTPYGDEAVICRLNGEVLRSIDSHTDRLMQDGDVLEIYPLIIGG